MRNSYEVAEIAELGKAKHMIMGPKYIDPFSIDNELGPWFGTWWFDIDESDE